MSNIPNYEQWATLNDYLNGIAVALGSQTDITTWEGIQRAVRLGVAPDVFPIGTQFKVNHSVYGEKLYDVVAHNHFKSVKDETAPTMTLMCHEVLPSLTYSAPEAFYYADSKLPAGTYKFTLDTTYTSWEAGTYQFTLTKELPAGGQLCFSGQANKVLTTLTVQAYASRTSTSVVESAAITLGNSGTNLGTFGKELNDSMRVAVGSNNYKESAIRQYLNSSAGADNVWTPQTKFDRPPDWVKTRAGFMNGLDSDFAATIGEVIIPCFTNDTYETPDSTVTKGSTYTLNDKFYLASHKEIFNTSSNALDEAVLFPYYEDASTVDYIKYKDDGSAVSWWTRTPTPGYTGSARYVNSDGSSRAGTVINSNGIAPVCTIV